MKESKNMIKDLDKNLSPSENQLTSEDDEEVLHNCENCDNIECKHQLILAKINDTAELASQIGHADLFNIMITILCALQHLYDDHTCLDKIVKACQEVYTELNPKEMKKSLN